MIYWRGSRDPILSTLNADRFVAMTHTVIYYFLFTRIDDVSFATHLRFIASSIFPIARFSNGCQTEVLINYPWVINACTRARYFVSQRDIHFG